MQLRTFQIVQIDRSVHVASSLSRGSVALMRCVFTFIAESYGWPSLPLSGMPFVLFHVAAKKVYQVIHHVGL